MMVNTVPSTSLRDGRRPLPSTTATATATTAATASANGRSGLTLLELMLVVGLLLLLTLATLPFGSRFFQTNQHDAALGRIRGKLRKAQAYSMDRRLNSGWGICLQGRVVRLYADSCAAPTQQEDYDLPDSVEVTGLGDIWFTPLRGEPSSAVTVTITSPLSSQQITVNAAGGIY
ncbi:MAG: hypothetical protein COU69_03105 [Candidatus Pacebacteria bacterium CG10_big_fil_rev_8_21_14_0_10_56_10]|nr:MAG: hypothetical protein COU69_03105 [Candidatus Pacebacteria bacterium CG10_big_fil_rev_8_21_14_0_10_56_10]